MEKDSSSKDVKMEVVKIKEKPEVKGPKPEKTEVKGKEPEKAPPVKKVSEKEVKRIKKKKIDRKKIREENVKKYLTKFPEKSALFHGLSSDLKGNKGREGYLRERSKISNQKKYNNPITSNQSYGWSAIPNSKDKKKKNVINTNKEGKEGKWHGKKSITAKFYSNKPISLKDDNLSFRHPLGSK